MSEAKLFLQLFEPELVLQFLKKEDICEERRRKWKQKGGKRERRGFETFEQHIGLKTKVCLFSNSFVKKKKKDKL